MGTEVYVCSYYIGIAIMVTPNLVIPEDLIKFPGGFLRKLFCHFLMSQFMVFLFGVASVYAIVFLSIERWFAVKHPFKYRTSISSTKMKICIALTWSVALLANTPHLLEMSPQYELNAANSCKWRSEKSHTRHILAGKASCIWHVLNFFEKCSRLYSSKPRKHKKILSYFKMPFYLACGDSTYS